MLCFAKLLFIDLILSERGSEQSVGVSREGEFSSLSGLLPQNVESGRSWDCGLTGTAGTHHLSPPAASQGLSHQGVGVTR